MKTKTCPMCQGEQFFTSTFVPTENFLLGAFKNVGVYPSVCLSCGFVAPTLDEVGLATIRQMARARIMISTKRQLGLTSESCEMSVSTELVTASPVIVPATVASAARPELFGDGQGHECAGGLHVCRPVIK